MRRIVKSACPQVLLDNAVNWLKEYLADPESNTKKYRYRHRDIKSALRNETGNKCIYCEAKLGHNTPGDIEHILPSSKVPNSIFDWLNLALACTECNRRKSDYYNANAALLNPYVEDVESKVIHLGPIVTWAPGNKRAEITVRMLELNSQNRVQLIIQKIEALAALDNLLERIEHETDPVLLALLKKELEARQQPDFEFSGMLCSSIEANAA